MNFNYYVCMPIPDIDKEFLEKAISTMGILKTMFVYIKENDEVGMDIVRLDEETYITREVYYDSGVWYMEESVKEIVKNFMGIVEMHLGDSYDG